jgi:hypothetical protein
MLLAFPINRLKKFISIRKFLSYLKINYKRKEEFISKNKTGNLIVLLMIVWLLGKAAIRLMLLQKLFFKFKYELFYVILC